MNILLAEDHTIVRNGIKMLLESEKDFKVVDEAVNGMEVLEKINKGAVVDIILTDINMPEMDGISLIREMKLIDPAVKVVILSMHDNEKYVIEAFIEGAAGYMLKNVSADELIFSLKYIHNGSKYLCSALTMKMMDNLINHKQYQYTANQHAIDFSMREIEILQLIAEGLTNSEMSEKLFISKRTIEGHRQSLLEKTESKNTAALIRFAVLNGIIQ
jgi:DNA-binding NarL/FixJ family response regulator